MPESQYTIRKKVFTLLGAQFHICNAEGKLVGFSKQKAFKLKEDIRVYTDETATQERMVIKARTALDISTAYDVVQSSKNKRLGMLKRHGLKSMLRDEWTVFDENEEEVGKIVEDSAILAMFRRFIANIIPQTFHLKDQDGNQLAELKQNFNPFVKKLIVTVYEDCPVNPYLVLAAGILLVAIEGRQQ